MSRLATGYRRFTDRNSHLMVGLGIRITILDAIGLLVAGWMLVVLIRALSGAWRAIDYGSYVTVDPGRAGLIFNTAIVLVPAVVSLTIGLIAPAWWRRAMVVLSLLPLPVLLYISHDVTSALVVIALLATTICLGRNIVGALFPQADALDAWALASGLGISGVAFLGFTLGIVGHLQAYALWPALAALAIAAGVGSRRFIRTDFSTVHLWLRTRIVRRPVYFLLSGMVIGFLWMGFVGALGPETGADAVVQRLTTAKRFAQTGRLGTDDPGLFTARAPAAGEIIYAVPIAMGPMQSPKLLNYAVGLLCVVLVFAIGRQLVSAEAGGIAALAFATIPQTSWLLQTAYLDLLTTFFALAALLAILVPAKPDWRSAVLAGIPIGVAVATKLHFGYVAVGLAITMGLILLPRAGLLRTSLLLSLLVAISVLSVAPFVVRTLVSLGNVPGLSVGVNSFTGGPTLDLARFGLGRSLEALVLLPYNLTFISQAFGTHTWGGLGFLLIGCVPLLLLTRPRLRTVAVFIGATIGLVLWFYTAQYLRYGLPLFAMFCAVGGAAYVTANSQTKYAPLRVILNFMLCATAVVGVSLQLKEPVVARDYVLGKFDEQTYLTRYLQGYRIMQLLNAEPGATRAFTFTDMPQFYSNVRLNNFIGSVVGREAPPLDAASDEDVLLAFLDAGGYSHIIVDRMYSMRGWRLLADEYGQDSATLIPNAYAYARLLQSWETQTMLGNEFLQRNFALVGSDANIYLYRLLPPEERGNAHSWAQGSELIFNGGFDVQRGDQPFGWTAVGQPRYDASGTGSPLQRPAAISAPNDGWSTHVRVLPDTEYVLSQATWSKANDSVARLQISWLDAQSNLISIAAELAPVSDQQYRSQSMLTTSPASAASAIIYAQSERGEVWFDTISLRSVLPDGNSVVPKNLLTDPNFSGFAARTSTAWRLYSIAGGRQASVSPNPYSTQNAVSAWPETGFWQLVAIEGGLPYNLGYKAWSDDPEAQARMQINWFTLSQVPITSTIAVIDVGDKPLGFSRRMEAPKDAAYAQVYVSVQSGGPVWFSDYALYAESSVR